jgi:predicted dehydrogenase
VIENVRNAEDVVGGMLRVGVVGLGKMGISHCAIINAHPLAKVAAVCDTSGLILEGFRKYTQIKTYSDYKTMIDRENLDALFVATPTSSHASIVRHAVLRGLHTFCEKPFVLDINDGVDLVAEAERQNLVNQVGYHLRFLGTFQECRRLVSGGVIGDVVHFTIESYGPVVVKAKGGTWRSSISEGGGCLHDYASHALDLIQYLSGPPVRARATIFKQVYSSTVEDAVYSTLTLANGQTGTLGVNWSDESYRKMTVRYNAFGTRGSIYADAQELRIFLKSAAPALELQEGWNVRYAAGLQEPVGFYLRGEEYSSQVDHFIRRIVEHDTDSRSSFRTALETDRSILMLKEDSMREGDKSGG